MSWSMSSTPGPFLATSRNALGEVEALPAVETGCRLVEREDLAGSDERAGHADQFLLPEGQVACECFPDVAEPDGVKCVDDNRSRVRGVAARKGRDESLHARPGRSAAATFCTT